MNKLSVRQFIAEDLREGPAWARTYQESKRVIDAMVADGEIERVPPEGQAYRNMIALTAKGARHYFPHCVGMVYTVKTRAEIRDGLADRVANGESIAASARAMGLPHGTIKDHWIRIRRDLGVQAV